MERLYVCGGSIQDVNRPIFESEDHLDRGEPANCKAIPKGQCPGAGEERSPLQKSLCPSGIDA